MAPAEKSQPLHNFSMPFLKWGNQKHLRCMKVNPNGEINGPDRRSSESEAESEGGKGADSENQSLRKRFSSSPSPARNLKFRRMEIGASCKKSKVERESENAIEEIRAKLLVHLRTAARKMKFPVPESGEEEELAARKMKFPVAEDGEEEESAARPWNLRTRRSACKDPNKIRLGSRNEKEPSPSLLPENLVKSVRLRSAAPVKMPEKNERRKFSVSLSRDEIEEDFCAMTGSRPARRPKKRAKMIQRQLDACFPGLWLSEVTPNSYKVADFQEPAQR